MTKRSRVAIEYWPDALYLPINSRDLMRSPSLCALVLLCSSASAQSQHPIDRYLGHRPVAETIASGSDGVQWPRDLDFCRVSGRERELWIVNKNGFVTIIYDAGGSTQWLENRRDSHSGHFMQRPTGIAMSANGNFGTCPESVYENSQEFMGPVLWTSDTSIFARIHQWDNLLGSHSDMLHESQHSMGIAADTGNVYWVFDGYHNAIYRYDFAVPHDYGDDDHSDGIILAYLVGLKRTKELPSHLVLEEKTGWLYTVDNGNNRIIRMQTRSGEYGVDLTDALEPLVRYGTMEGATVETVDTGIDSLCGIDLWDERLIVSVNSTGEIRVYNTATPEPTYLGSIQADPGIMGIKIGPDSAIWYVNHDENTVVRLTPGELLAVRDEASLETNAIYPSPASTVVRLRTAKDVEEIRFIDPFGNVVLRIDGGDTGKPVDIRQLPNGVYYCQFVSRGEVSYQRFVVSR